MIECSIPLRIYDFSNYISEIKTLENKFLAYLKRKFLHVDIILHNF